MRVHTFAAQGFGGFVVYLVCGLTWMPTRLAMAESPLGPGDPYPDLAPSLVGLFVRGQERFIHEFTPEEGLGPVYNETSCQTCHGGHGGIPGGPDALGLGSIHNVNHIGFDNHGFFDPMRELGGSQLSRQTIADDGYPSCRIAGEVVPATATIASVRNTPAVLGLGLVDAIPDQEILSHQNVHIDGIRGVANWGIELRALDIVANSLTPQLQDFGPPRVGRFGWKAQTATLEQFSAEPLNTELGVSSRYFPQERTDRGVRLTAFLPNACNAAVQGECPPHDASQSRQSRPACLATGPDDPDSSQALALYHFQALLAPAPQLPRSPGSEADWGGELFARVGCALCHVPEAHTASEYHLRLADGTSVRVPQLEAKTFYPFSDFLLHDMGPALADDAGTTVGRVQGRARGSGWRTTPLWGIRLKATYLHDGRTTELREAIRAHGGEARIVRGRYENLSDVDQKAVLEYILTL